MVYAQVKDEFPERKKDFNIELIVRPEEVHVEEKDVPASVKYQFSKKDGSAVVQFDAGNLIVACEGACSSWKGFKDMTLRVFESYRGVMVPEFFKTVWIKYVNIMKLPGPGVDPGEYFRFYLDVPKRLPKDWAPIVLSADFRYGKDLLLLSLSPVASSGVDTAFMFDIGYLRGDAKGLGFNAISNWLGTAHKRIVFAFESGITSKMRKMFY